MPQPATVPPNNQSLAKPLQNAYLIAAAGTICAAVNSLHNNLRAGSLFVDSYWVGFYITNYKDGFRRRALVGTIFRAIAPHGISVVAINVVALLAAAALLALLIRSFVRLSTVPSYRTSLFTFAFFVSTFAAMFIDTLGDTLQLTFGIFLAVCFLVNRVNTGSTLRLLLGLLVVVLGFFIHEASLFFLVPALPFFARARPRLPDFILPSLLLLGLMYLSVHWSLLQPRLTYTAVLFPQKVPFTGLAATPDFKSLLRTEAAFDFGSLHNILRFCSKCLRLLVLLFAGIIAVAACFPRQLFNRFLVLLATVLLYNVPLWFIAHDWGRFLAYSFFFAIVGTSFWQSTPTEVAKSEHRLLAKTSDAIRIAGSPVLISLAVLYILLTSQTLFSRITGISVRTLVASLLMAALALAFSRSLQRTSLP